jgi:hypothetical protein
MCLEGEKLGLLTQYECVHWASKAFLMQEDDRRVNRHRNNRNPVKTVKSVGHTSNKYSLPRAVATSLSADGSTDSVSLNIFMNSNFISK